ncbi:MAG: IclR family transcriptional regulator [Rhizobiaceae bacterium]
MEDTRADNAARPQTAKRRETGTLGKAMAVLDVIASSEKPIRFTEILDRCDQPRGTLHRQLGNLVEEGLLTINSDHTYAPGLTLLRFASKAWAGNHFRIVAEPHMQALHAATGETVHLGMLSGTKVIYVDKVEGSQSVRMYSQIGNVSPVYCTGIGKAAISTLPPEDLQELVRQIDFHKFTKNTLHGPKALLAEIDQVKQSGIAFDREEHEVGIHCVSAPIKPIKGETHAGISVTGPVYRVSKETLEGWADQVRKTAQNIEEDLGTRLGPRA